MVRVPALIAPNVTVVVTLTGEDGQAQDPLDRPERLKKTRRPLVHAASKVERESYLTVREVFVDKYHEASAELLRGGRDVVFPCWSFPPGLPFVRTGPIFRPFWDGCMEELLTAEIRPGGG